MPTPSVQALLDDLGLVNPSGRDIAMVLRSLIHAHFSNATEAVKYGGILFTSGVPFCGVFVYQAHVSLEFSHGAAIADPFGLLEGSGKGRRHLKLRAPDDIARLRVVDYLPLAHTAARAQ